MRLRAAFASVILTFLLTATAWALPPEGAANVNRPLAELSGRDAVILGVIEGVTEFLPISSTGHLIVAARFLHLDSEQPLADGAGHALWYRAPSPRHPAGVPLTLKLAADTYSIVIQFGAIAAVLLLYWQPILSMARGALGQDPAGRGLLVNVIIAFIPAAVIGLLIHDWIDAHLFSIGAVIIAQAGGALLMFYAESWRKRHAPAADKGPEILELSRPAAVRIGFMQCVAMWPGTSRSMMTIVGGYFARLNPRHAAEFSFLLGFATLTAATIFKSYQNGHAMIQVFGWSHVLLGCVVAAITAGISVRSLVTWLTRHGLAVFAVYRLIVAAGLAFIFFGPMASAEPKMELSPQVTTLASTSRSEDHQIQVLLTRDELVRAAEIIVPTGVGTEGTDRVLFFGPNAVHAGRHFIVHGYGADYDLVLAKVDSDSFTIRYRDQEVSRPIKSFSSRKQP